ncbi:MAG TPA: YetF domain-containing protein [Candidatus Eisenbacteria bacterium]|nr:YetF domain-containing protein [Candidatus Eisenbacteria bacterium]
MDAVLRAIAAYLFLLVVFRIAGERTLAGITTFDFVLLLIIAEATQQGIASNDYSMTTAGILVVTLVGINILLSWLKQKFPTMDKVVEGVPMVIVEDGKPIEQAMTRARVDESDILAAARERQGLQRMDQVMYAVLERTGEISIIPKRRSGSDMQH